MGFSSYLNMGISYDNEYNYFNALVAYENAISKQSQLTGGLNNIGVTMGNVGLQQQSLSKYDRAINYYEKGRHDRGAQVWKYYFNRASIFRILNRKYLFESDIEKSLKLNPCFENIGIELAKFEISNGNFKKGEECLSKVIKNFSSKSVGWRARARIYEIIGRYDDCLKDYIKSAELLKEPKITFYDIGRILYHLGDTDNARLNYDRFIKTGLWDHYYDVVNRNIGIVQYVDTTKGYGFIFGPTWLNNSDSIFFRVADCIKIPKKGDRVRYSINYAVHKNKLLTSATNVDPYLAFDNPKQRDKTTTHCIIHGKQNSFRASTDFKYIQFFYPFQTLYSFSAVEMKLDNNLKQNLYEDGYLFLEATIDFDKNSCFNIISVKEIKNDNIFANKTYSRPQYKRRRYNGYLPQSSWTCSICDGDETTGCQMSDPQYCPKGRGI